MVYRRFYINIVIRVILITFTGLLFIPLVSAGRNFLFSYISLGMLFFLQLGYLLYYIGKINRNLENFLLSVREENLSMSFSDMSRDRTFIQLNDYFHEINEIISKVKRDKETQSLYLQFVVENVDAGIFAFGNKGEIELWNKAAARILGISNPGTINRINMVEQGMEDFVLNMKPGMEALKRITVGGQLIPVAFRCSKFSIAERQISLISFQNIKTQLEDNELDAWQKLIRVLTHEIMNSVAPLSSLSSTLNWRYNHPAVPVNNDESLFEDTKSALRIIESRSRGLIDFVGSYRKLTGIPALNLSLIKVNELFQDVYLLMKEEAEEHGVNILIDISDPGLPVKADKKLVEQILINLVKNAVQCFDGRENKIVELRGRYDGESVLLHVANNGPAIPAEIMEKIFIPFFTTREKGSGIGLSFTRQVMRLHGGSITVSSDPDKETVFSLRF